MTWRSVSQKFGWVGDVLPYGVGAVEGETGEQVGRGFRVLGDAGAEVGVRVAGEVVEGGGGRG